MSGAHTSDRRLMRNFISIVVPTKNEELYILQCIDSLLSCKYPKELFEVIVVDNNSTDSTTSLLATLDYPNLKVIQSNADTIAGVRMDGFALCRGDVLGFVDADSVVENSWMQNGVDILESGSDVSCVGFAAASPSPRSSWVERTWHGISSSSKWKNRQEVPWLSSFNLLVKREFFEMVKGFDRTLTTCEDADLGYKLSSVSKVIFSDETKVCHLGTVKTVHDFYLKELWRGRSSFRQFWSSTNKCEHYKSVMAPIMYTADVFACLFLSVLGVVGYHSFAIPIFLTGGAAILLPLALSLRANATGICEVAKTSFLYFIYLLARGVAIVLP